MLDIEELIVNSGEPKVVDGPVYKNDSFMIRYYYYHFNSGVLFRGSVYSFSDDNMLLLGLFELKCLLTRYCEHHTDIVAYRFYPFETVPLFTFDCYVKSLDKVGLDTLASDIKDLIINALQPVTLDYA